jgi:hypothetical protein
MASGRRHFAPAHNLPPAAHDSACTPRLCTGDEILCHSNEILDLEREATERIACEQVEAGRTKRSREPTRWSPSRSRGSTRPRSARGCDAGIGTFHMSDAAAVVSRRYECHGH